MNGNDPTDLNKNANQPRRRPFLAVFILIQAIAACVLTLVILSTGVGVGVVIAVAALMLVSSVVVSIVVARSIGTYQQRRQEAVADFAAAHELEVLSGDTGALKREFRMLPELKHGGTVKNAYEGFLAGRRLVLFEHVYTVQTGSAPIPVLRTVCAAETPRWPRIEIAPNRGLRRLAPRSFGRARLELDLPEFNRRMRVKAADPDFALTLLSPELQRHILTRPTSTWRIIDGWVCLLESGAMRFDRAADSIARLEQFLELLPQELEYWPSDEL